MLSLLFHANPHRCNDFSLSSFLEKFCVHILHFNLSFVVMVILRQKLYHYENLRPVSGLQFHAKLDPILGLLTL
jgi:hypothetical protein